MSGDGKKLDRIDMIDKVQDVREKLRFMNKAISTMLDGDDHGQIGYGAYLIMLDLEDELDKAVQK